MIDDLIRNRYNLFDVGVFVGLAVSAPYVPWWGTVALFVMGAAASAWLTYCITGGR